MLECKAAWCSTRRRIGSRFAEKSRTTALTEPSDSSGFSAPYVGWIPTANGRLSFRHVGDATYPSICKYTNFVDANRVRCVAGYQRRGLSDLLFKRVTAKLFHRTGDFWFTVACRSVAEAGDVVKLDALRGEICIFKSKWDWKTFYANEKPHELIKEINAQRLLGNYDSAASRFERFAIVTAYASDIVVSFELRRDGVIRISNPVFKDSILVANSEKYSRNEIGVQFLPWISNQAYFFMRDICHSHQHHSPSEDTILILQEADDDRRDWRNSVIYSLQHYIIKLRRRTEVEDLHRALGILAYAHAFKGICAVVAKKGDAKLQPFQFDAIAGSIKARIDELDAGFKLFAQDRSWAISKSASYRGALIGVTAVICSIFITFMQPYVRAHEKTFVAYGETIAHHFTQIATAGAAAFGLVWAYFGERTFRPTARKPGWIFIRQNILGFRDIVAISMFRPLTVGVALLIVAAAILALAISRN